MKPETKKLMEEMAIQHNEALKYFENISFDQVYKNGFTASHTLAEQEIAELKLQLQDRTEKYKIAMDKGVDVLSSQVKDLTASLKSAVDALSIIRSNEWIEGECIISGKFYRKTVEQISDETLTQLKAKHPDMFKGETK